MYEYNYPSNFLFLRQIYNHYNYIMNGHNGNKINTLLKNWNDRTSSYEVYM